MIFVSSLEVEVRHAQNSEEMDKKIRNIEVAVIVFFPLIDSNGKLANVILILF